MGAGKKHKVRLAYFVTDLEGTETLGAELRFGQVKQEHLPIYNSVINRNIEEAKTELAQMEAEGKFA